MWAKPLRNTVVCVCLFYEHLFPEKLPVGLTLTWKMVYILPSKVTEVVQLQYHHHCNSRAMKTNNSLKSGGVTAVLPETKIYSILVSLEGKAS